MVADIEVIAENKRHYASGYFELMADLFLELWVGFIAAIERDLSILNLASEKGNEGLPCQAFPLSLSGFPRSHTTVRKFRHLSFLQNPDVLPDVNPGFESQQHEIHGEISDTQWTDLTSRIRAKRIYTKVRTIVLHTGILNCRP